MARLLVGDLNIALDLSILWGPNCAKRSQFRLAGEESGKEEVGRESGAGNCFYAASSTWPSCFETRPASVTRKWFSVYISARQAHAVSGHDSRYRRNTTLLKFSIIYSPSDSV